MEVRDRFIFCGRFCRNDYSATLLGGGCVGFALFGLLRMGKCCFAVVFVAYIT